ncbi:MAG TPA: competence/damage-inducible protein A [Candidatus Aphodomonas merdavium]|nr:competence/damage-inducible protein A [Candidatus Aphodomonas merdavium]
MIAEIVAVGTELLMGQVLNTDAQFIARRLSEAGITLHRQIVVGDNPERIRQAVRDAIARADIVITTGGLGPTADDITKQACAQALGLAMERRPEAEAMVRAWFAKNGREMTENNLRQADFAKGARILPNANGTAPACIVEKDGKAVVNLPGPPNELTGIFDSSVMPYLAERSGAVIVSRYLRIFGMGESSVASRLQDLMETCENPSVAPYCSTGEVQLRLTARCKTREEADALLDPLEREIRARLGNVIYAVTQDSQFHMEHALVCALRQSGKTLSTAESCTGGMISSRIVNVTGASDVFLQGFVTYANEAKVRALGVREETLAAYGAVSRETALEMAEGARRAAGTDFAVSVTGVAGPGGGTPEKPVGLVWLGLASQAGAWAKALHLTGSRERIRTLAALHAMHWALEACREENAGE